MGRVITIMRRPLAVPLGLPGLGPAAATDGATDDSIETASHGWSAGSFVVLLCGGRDSSTSTHNAPSITGVTTETVTKRAEAEASLGGVYVKGSIWTTRILSSSAGPVAWSAGDDQFQKVLMGLIVPGATAFEYKAEGQNATGAGVTPSYNGVPSAGALSIAFLLQDGSGGSGFAVTGHSAIAGTAATVSALKVGAFAQLGSVSQTLTASGMESTKPHVVLGVTLL